jgi:hypothetical protein
MQRRTFTPQRKTFTVCRIKVHAVELQNSNSSSDCTGVATSRRMGRGTVNHAWKKTNKQTNKNTHTHTHIYIYIYIYNYIEKENMAK